MVDNFEYFQMMSFGHRFETRILLCLSFEDLFYLRDPQILRYLLDRKTFGYQTGSNFLLGKTIYTPVPLRSS